VLSLSTPQIKDNHTNHLSHVQSEHFEAYWVVVYPSQHQRAHEDHAAQQFTFYDVISARKGAPPELRSLQNRCLIPGLYATHLERWLTYYPANQVCIETNTSLCPQNQVTLILLHHTLIS